MANIIQRNNGYFIMVSDGYDIEGKQIRHTCTWTPAPGMTERQKKKGLEQFVLEFEQRIKQGRSTDGAITFKAFSERFMAQYAAGQLAPKTVARYAQLLGRINPAIGHIRLEQLQVQHLAELYKQLQGAKEGRSTLYTATKEFFDAADSQNLTKAAIAKRSDTAVNTVYRVFENRGITKKAAAKIAKAAGLSLLKAFEHPQAKRGLSERTIRHHHMLISTILNKAVEWELIKENKARLIRPPKVQEKEIAYFSEQEAETLIRELSKAPHQEAVMIKLLLLTGMRRGELCGLEWKDIDVDKRTLAIRRASQYIPELGVFTKEPKTKSSRRVLPLSGPAAQVLEQHRAWQVTQAQRFGEGWNEAGRLFTTIDGRPVHPDTVTGWFSKFVARTGLPDVTVHGLRHTFISLMIAKGVDIVTVASLAGHAQASTTINMYAHAVQERRASAIEAVGELLGGVV
jgi:integrase